MTKIVGLHREIASTRTEQQKLFTIMLDTMEKAQQHYYKLSNAHTRATPVIELGAQIKPTIGSTALGNAKDFYKKMKELTQIFDEVDAHFKNFIEDLMKIMPSIASIAQ